MSFTLFDFQHFGFDKAEIDAFLKAHGITIDDVPLPKTMVPVDLSLQWKHMLALCASLAVDEVAHAFADIDPYPDLIDVDKRNSSKLQHWKMIIRRAIEDGELATEEPKSEGSFGGLARKVRQVELANWCASKGLTYPLPGKFVLPTDDAGVRAELVACKRELDQLKVGVGDIERVRTLSETRRNELDRLRDGLRKAQEKLGILESDALQGKGRQTARKIIGGLLIDGYGFDIHADRFDRLGEIVEALEQVGAGVNEKTLRKWIVEAASVIEPQLKKK